MRNDTNAPLDDEAISPVVVAMSLSTVDVKKDAKPEATLPLESGLRYDIYLAFCKPDTAVAAHIVYSLRKRNIAVSTSFEAYEDGLDDPIKESALFAICLSSTLESDRISRSDAQLALTLGKATVGVLINPTEELGFGWVRLVEGSCSLGTVSYSSSTSSKANRSSIDALAKIIQEKAALIPGSPSFRIAKQESELETPDDQVPYMRPGSSLSDAHRRPRLSILRPRSSLYNIGTANKLHLPSTTNETIPEVIPLNGLRLLARILKPSSVSSTEQLNLQYSRFHPATRGWLLTDIAKWATETSDTNTSVMWIHGKSGSGKTVASAAAIRHLSRYSTANIFLSWVFLRPGVNASVCSVINDLAYRLADSWGLFESALTEVGEARLEEASGSTLPQQLKMLLTDPLLLALSKIVSEKKPMVLFVVDGLDNVRTSRRDFIIELKSTLQILPLNVKFLFTSAATDEIKEDMLPYLNPTQIELNRMFQRKDLNKVHREIIESFIQLNVVPEKEDLDDLTMTLTAKADGMFLYSRFAFEPIGMDGSNFKEVKQAVRAIESLPKDFGDVILGLLSFIFRDSQEEEIEIFRQIMSVLVLLQSHVSVSTLAGLMDISPGAIRRMLLKVSCFLEFLEKDLIQISHELIGEFLISDECDDPRFRIYKSEAEVYLLLHFFKHLNTKLRSNPLNLEDPSTWLNQEIPDLHKCINDRIPDHIQYICKNLGTRLLRVSSALRELNIDRKFVHAIQDLVGAFVHEKLLEWIEALSLMGCLESLGLPTLNSLSTFLTEMPSATRISVFVGILKRNAAVAIGTRPSDTSLKVPSFIEPFIPTTSVPLAQTTALICDAIKLLTCFSYPLSKASFHVYTTAIPLAPSTSLLHKQYSKMSHRAAFSSQGISRRTPIVIRGIDKIWPSLTWTLTSHTGVVTAVCASIDGKWIVSASFDKTVRVFDADSGRLYRVLEGHLDHVWNISISPDGSRIVSGSIDQTVKTWDLLTGECVKTISAKTFSINTLVISRDGTQLVSINNSENSVVVRDCMSGDVVWIFKGHQGPVVCVCIAPDGSVVATGGSDGTIRLWDLKTGVGLRTFEGHTETVNAVSMSLDCKWLISGSKDETIRLWDIATGRCWQVLVGHDDSVECVFFMADGKKVVSGSKDRTVRVWEINTDHPTISHISDESDGQGAPVRAMKISSNGFVLITAGIDGLIKLWSTETGKLIRTVELFNLDVGNSFQDAVNKVASVEVDRESDYEYLRFGKKTHMAMTAISMDSTSIMVPGGARVPLNRIEIKRRESSTISIVKVDGRTMMLTKPQVDAIEAQIEAVKKGGFLTDSTFADGQLIGNSIESVSKESWIVDSDGWVLDKQVDGARRFWLPRNFRGDIASHQDRIVAVASHEGQLLVIHV